MSQWGPDLSAEISNDLMKRSPRLGYGADCTCDTYFSVYSSTGTVIINVFCMLKDVKDYKEL